MFGKTKMSMRVLSWASKTPDVIDFNRAIGCYAILLSTISIFPPYEALNALELFSDRSIAIMRSTNTRIGHLSHGLAYEDRVESI